MDGSGAARALLRIGRHDKADARRRKVDKGKGKGKRGRGKETGERGRRGGIGRGSEGRKELGGGTGLCVAKLGIFFLFPSNPSRAHPFLDSSAHLSPSALFCFLRFASAHSVGGVLLTYHAFLSDRRYLTRRTTGAP